MFFLPKDNHDEEKDVEPELGKPELLLKANTTEHFSDIDEMSSLFVSLVKRRFSNMLVSINVSQETIILI